MLYWFSLLLCNLYYNNWQKSWDTFAFLGHFLIHTGPAPPLTPQTMLDVSTQNFVRVLTLYRGEGELQENFEKDALFYEGIQKLQNNMNTALRSQGLLSMIVSLISVAIKSPVDVPLLTGDKHKKSCRVPDITFQVPHGQPVESIHSTAVISADSVKLNCNLPDSPE